MSEILSIVQAGHSKAQSEHICQSIINGIYPIDELMTCFFSTDLRICQRASWPLTLLAEQSPDTIMPYMKRMINHLDRPNHDAVVRNILRSWQFMSIPEDFLGEAYEKAFAYLSDPKQAIAIRVFAMTTCVNIAEIYPELGSEIRQIILDNYDHSSSGFRGRGKKELKRLAHIEKSTHT